MIAYKGVTKDMVAAMGTGRMDTTAVKSENAEKGEKRTSGEKK